MGYTKDHTFIMLSIFKRSPVYIKLFKNRVEMINLETGETISRESVQPFSSQRLVIADFNKADALIRSILNDLLPKKGIFPRQTKILIQQVVSVEGGLSEIEKRALRDLGEMAGGTRVILVDHFRQLDISEANLAFEKK
jgi:actin-like ATPase involved in cell morphogenesis